MKFITVLNTLKKLHDNYGSLKYRVTGQDHFVGLKPDETFTITMVSRDRFMEMRPGTTMAFRHLPL
ncbi:hypothetical protein [Thermoplasma sp.]|uniref:hypothetical protein n=1 Tax=Thermoplasma sp. TaxID=1973142 RepID=UPI00127E6AB7|nr:hypothetical protein [Thermoplasma sp.]KAA8922436.1 MAG: hypothetical protein F6Q11_04245 [Thermoplasma sp.]